MSTAGIVLQFILHLLKTVQFCYAISGEVMFDVGVGRTLRARMLGSNQ